ncbi:hypothetical protein BCR41DRAFT_32336 [Lobosporangium transversale]|uniref:Uncharacterized protein n=1 Tax=Lobosporangium transversale TaxID=64571 RepID=A0A1Y2GV75_9FUNG|nr:hypothetical protein BCR41DRAFT_32336 [Lobosporangium transversale]ORZ19949.1 hypothetical protein BCR41DRAFT_32336 [Lobosporangium transversale]|eukprot:XP_021882489.1 hypothetical protein BCR41DRAFT_32336 [Lobosporangium transversale]
MAHCYKRMGKTIRAAFLYRQVRMLDSCFVKDMYHYGVCLKQLSKIANLNKLARDLRDCNDKHPDTWCVMALLWDVEQEKDKALQMVHKALELQPDHYGALQLRGQLLMETKPNESLKSFRDANRIEKDIISYEGLVNAYILLGRQLEAVGTAKEVMELMSDSAHALAIYGIAIYHSGEERVDEALEVLQKAISMDAGCIQAALCLVTIYEKLERYDEAIQILDQQIDYQPPDAIHVRKAEIYTTMEQWEKAFLSYQSAISANFDNVRAKEGMARVEKILTGGDDEDDDGVEGSDNNDELEGDGIDTDLDHDQDLMAGNLDEDEVLTGEEDQGEDFEEGYSFRQQEQQQQPSAPQQLDASLLQMAESFRTRQLQQQQQQRQSNAVTPVRPLAQNSYEHTGPPPLIRRPRQQQLQQFTQHASQHQQQQQQHASSSSTFGFRVDSPHTPPRMTSPVSPSSRTPPGAPVMSRPYQSIHRLPLDRDSPEPDMEE